MVSTLSSKLRTVLVCAFHGIATVALAQTTIRVGPLQPYTTIQAGIDAANPGDTVLVAPGTYNEDIDFKGKAITVISSKGAASTIIQGDGSKPVVSFMTGETRNSVLNGFTVQGVSNPTTSQYYSGIQVGSAPTILNNIITNNPCNGIDVDFGGALIQGNVISNTNASHNGSCTSFTGSAIVLGGGYSQPSVVIGNKIINNTHAVGYDGGGIQIWAAENAVIENNVIAGNATPTGEGGGIAAFNSDRMIIAQNLFYGNVAEFGGGAISLHPPGDTQGPFIGLIQGNTFVGNTSVSSQNEYGEPAPSQVYVDGNLAQWEFTDNIVVGNDANPALVCGTIYNYLSITPFVIDHNDIYNPKGPAYGGACPDQTGQYGNISADPLFKNPAGNDYHLLAASPAIDAGNNSALQLLANLGSPLAADFDGNPRVQDATGKGYPVVDMGAYEFTGKQTGSPTTAVLNPSAYYMDGGQPFTLTANMYSPLGTPTGKVSFFEDGKAIGTASIDAAGAASLTLGSGLVPGTHAFLATYAAEGVYTPCESVKIYVLVNAYGVTLNLTSAPNPSNVGQTVTFQIEISSANGVPSGIVTLSDNSKGTTLATLTPDANGRASYLTSALAVGSHDIVAFYGGNATYTGATNSVLQVVQNGAATTTALTCLPATINISGTAQLTATVTSSAGTPTGSVSFSDNGSPLATNTLAAGTTSFTYTGSSAGTHTITATYSPTGSFAASSSTCTETVNALPTTSVLAVAPPTSTYGSSVTLTATVSPATPPGPSAPTGTVTFYNGASVLGTGAVSGGIATLITSALPGGTDTLSCAYSGNSIYAVSNCNPVPVAVNPAPSALSLTSTSNPAAYLSSVTFKLALTVNGKPAPAGVILHLTVNNQTATLTTDAAGSAAFALPSLLPGSYPVSATFAGTADFQPASASLTQVITAASTSTSLTAAPSPGNLNQPVTLTATVASGSTPVSTGNLTFYDGSTSLGASSISAAGTATLNATFTVLGTHNLTAAYGATANFLASTSPVFKETIIAGDFSITASPAASSVYMGLSSSATIDVKSINGFNQTLALACSGLPANTTCAFTPDTLSNGQGTTKLVIQTAAPQRTTAASISILGALALLLLPARKRRRSLLLRAGLFVLGFAVLAGFAGCASNNPIAGGTPPGTYHIAITATTTGTAPLTHAADFTLTVKSLF